MLLKILYTEEKSVLNLSKCEMELKLEVEDWNILSPKSTFRFKYFHFYPKRQRILNFIS
jgi:hypothetical protein